MIVTESWNVNHSCRLTKTLCIDLRLTYGHLCAEALRIIFFWRIMKSIQRYSLLVSFESRGRERGKNSPYRNLSFIAMVRFQYRLINFSLVSYYIFCFCKVFFISLFITSTILIKEIFLPFYQYIFTFINLFDTALFFVTLLPLYRQSNYEYAIVRDNYDANVTSPEEHSS